MSAEKTLDCQKCGACCVASAWSGGDFEPFAEVSEHEGARIQKALPMSVVRVRPTGWTFQEPTLAMEIKNDRYGRCVALKGTVGRKVSCSIYRARPAGCRDFEPGSERCLEIRRTILGPKA